TAENLPPHSHAYTDIYYSESGGTVTVPNNRGSHASDNDNKGYEMNRATLPDQGSASPVPLTPPFLALLYCLKGERGVGRRARRIGPRGLPIGEFRKPRWL